MDLYMIKKIKDLSSILSIGITGQSGFIGTHLYNSLALYPKAFTRVPFEDEYFNDENLLETFVKQCDVIIHLAALNRHPDPQVIYETNVRLVEQIISACDNTGSTPHIVFSSSTQEMNDNPYGESKKTGRELFKKWAKINNTKFSGLIIPNVYGPYGKPYFNSVVATFCHQLTHNETPQINIDAEVHLIYIQELIALIIDYILDKRNIICNIKVPHTSIIIVSKLLEKLTKYYNEYYKKGYLPDVSNCFERNLFITFMSYIDLKSFYPFPLKQNVDNRGTFIEIVKLDSGGQVSFSTTKTGIIRGNHFHTRKIERFAVIKGKAEVNLRKIGTEDVLSFIVDGSAPAFIDMPVWYTHNLKNVGQEDLYTLFWINEHFNPEDQDTYYEEV